MKNHHPVTIVGSVCLLVLLGLGIWFFLTKEVPLPPVVVQPEVETTTVAVPTSTREVIGYSVNGRAIESYSFGTGSTTLLFVGGIHGGYEWNSVLLAYEFIDQFIAETIVLPSDLRIVIIPALNPDGLFSVVQKEGRFTAAEIPPNDAHTTGQGRFNANGVDLNRNFACKWQPKSTWRGKVVSAGNSAFSEPEAAALRDLVLQLRPETVVFWHSQANTVYASECEAGILPQTLIVMNKYASAAKYNAVASFDAYPISGDAEGWLASINIPAITVELETRTQTEWTRNKAGVEALLSLYTSL
jgi:hypothetical protein